MTKAKDKAKAKTKTAAREKKKVAKPAKPTKKPRVKRSYRDYERIAAVSLCKQVGPQAASEQLKIPEATIRAWEAGWRFPAAADMYGEGRGILALIYEKAAWESLSLARDKVHEAPYKDLMRGAGLATDKMLVLQGKPNQIGASTRTTMNADPLAELINVANPEDMPTLLRLLNRLNNAIGPTQPDGVSGDPLAGTAVVVRSDVLAHPESRPAT